MIVFGTIKELLGARNYFRQYMVCRAAKFKINCKFITLLLQFILKIRKCLLVKEMHANIGDELIKLAKKN